MALHNLKITVIDGGRQVGGEYGSSLNSNDSKDDDKSGKNSLLYKVLNYNQTIKSSVKKVTSPTTFFAVQAGVNLATQTARQFINYYVSDIGRSSGDSNHQAIVNRRIEQVTDGLSIGQGALSGAAAGSIGGLPGMIIGGVIGAASSGINLGFKYAERQRTYAHEIFQENNSQAYNLARVNFSAMTGRVR